MKNKLKSLIVLFLAFAICLLAGCGANVSTKLTINEKFEGTREMYARIDADDISKVTGGAAGLENVIKSSKPADIDYSMGADGSTTVITFSIKFSSLDEYRTKVTNIIKAGLKEDEIFVPEIIFEHGKTPFKEGFKLSENFTSIKLLDWYINALEAANIISESKSNWYEMGDNTIVFAGNEYDSGSQLEADEQIKRCLEDISVKTVVNTDGTYERIITFTSTDEIEEELSAVDCELKDYLKKLCPEGDSFVDISEDDSSLNKYQFTLKSDSVKDLLKKTDKVLQSNNSLEIEITAKEEAPGMADIKVKESLDGSYYIDYDQSELRSELQVYSNVNYDDVTRDEYNVNDGVVSYYPAPGSEYTFTGEWQVGFGEIYLDVSATSLNSIDVSLEFNPMEGLSDELVESAGALIKESAEYGGTLKEKKNVYTVSFSGKVEDVVEEINNFVAGADGFDEAEVGANPYFSVELAEYNTLSRLTKGVSGDISYNFSPVIGNAEIKLKNTDGLFGGTKYATSGSIDGDVVSAASNGDFSFYSENASILGIAVLAVAAILLLGGIVLLLISRKEFALLKNLFKRAPKEKIAVAAAPTAPQPVVQVQQAPVRPIPVQPVAPAQPMAPPVPVKPVSAPTPAAPPQQVPSQPVAPKPVVAPPVVQEIENDEGEEELI